ncbi:dihydrofolate reductase [uncultured Corynebacterium sp.]|uniref:dihydrofolate reductase n=1 Tax=uncultured Corynebacterium sp. TaxID=159447 RepID=UPI0025CF588A|nr:dihydrofolate reductase [uncultured Corynebacterium sp.]
MGTAESRATFAARPQITRADLPDFPADVEIGMIWAQTTGGVIGDGDDMPWYLPEDLAHFQSSTMGTPVVMGRVSWEALDPRFRPLPGRDNHIITRDADYDAPGGTVHTSLPDAVLAAGRAAVDTGASTVWILGGGHVYRQCVRVADRVVVTEIDCGAPDRFRVYAPDMRVEPGFTAHDGPWLTSARGTALTGEHPVRYRICDFTRDRS